MTNNESRNENTDHSHDKDDDKRPKTTKVQIDRDHYEFAEANQTGRSLKGRAGVPLTDELYLRRPGADLLVGNDDPIVIKNGDRFYSQPPATYGKAPVVPDDELHGFSLHPQADGWTYAIHDTFELPDAYTPRVVRLLIKLPPTFPDAAPDMFFVTPVVRVTTGGAPRGTSDTQLLDQPWQQFSWHLAPGSWRPGISTFLGYVACVRARFAQRD
jgi:hypothetical protein